MHTHAATRQQHQELAASLPSAATMTTPSSSAMDEPVDLTHEVPHEPPGIEDKLISEEVSEGGAGACVHM
jgi:hypothetical protein